MQRPNRRALGFTLVEIAVVLVIVGLITAGIAALLTGFLKSTRSRIAADNAVIVQQALQRFAERSGRLPCPAIAAALNGAEDPATNSPATTCAATVVAATGMARGVIPWSAVGLSLEQVQDGHGRLFTYHVTMAATLTTLNTTTVGGVMGNMTLHSATPVAMGSSVVAGRNQINSCWVGAAMPGMNENSCNLNAVVVLLSHGENGLGGFTSQGGTVPAPTEAGEVENTNATTAFVKSDPTATGFDDLVFGWAPEELLEPLLRRGTIKSASVASTETLQRLALQVSNAIVNSATQCAPLPCTNVATIPVQPAGPPPAQTVVSAPPVTNIPMTNDGWNSPIAYTTAVGGNNLCALPPGAVAFTLVSWGADRTTFGLNTVNPNTNIYDDAVVNVTVDQMRSQIMTRYGSC